MLNVGVADLKLDLAAKVELAAARAKMIKPDAVVEEVKEEVEVPVEEVTEDVVDTPAAEEIAEEVVEEEKREDAPTEEKEEKEEKEDEKEPEVEIEKPDLEALKEGVADGDSGAANSTRVTADNVLEIMAAVPFKQRVAFYKQHEHLINEAAKRRG